MLGALHCSEVQRECTIPPTGWTIRLCGDVIGKDDKWHWQPTMPMQKLYDDMHHSLNNTRPENLNSWRISDQINKYTLNVYSRDLNCFINSPCTLWTPPWNSSVNETMQTACYESFVDVTITKCFSSCFIVSSSVKLWSTCPVFTHSHRR